MTGGGGEDYKCDNPFRDVYIYICVYIYLDSQLFRLLQRQNSKRTINRPRKILYIIPFKYSFETLFNTTPIIEMKIGKILICPSCRIV